MKLLFFIASLLAGVLAVPTGKAVFFGPGKAVITYVDNLDGTVTATMTGTFDLTGKGVGQSQVYLSYNMYAPLPVNTSATAVNSTLGPQYHNVTINNGALNQLYTFGSDTFKANLTSGESFNILGTSVSVMIGSTIVETAVIGTNSTDAFSDISRASITAPGDSGELAGAIISPTNMTLNYPRGVIYFTPGPNKTIGGEVIPTVKVTLFVDAGPGLLNETWAVHVHQYGYLDNVNNNPNGNGLTTGLHFNPLKNPHGNLYLGQSRHVGDMGNFTLLNGTFVGVYYAENMSIYGKNSILGRGVIVHKKSDNANFNFTKYHRISYDIGYAGDAGPRLGQGVIGAANNFSTTPITSTTAFGIQMELPTSDNSACMGLPVGQQRRYILNVVSASVVGTEIGKMLANNSAAWGMLFPVGFDWTNGKAFDGLVNNAVTKSFFNGVSLNSTGYVSPLAYTPQINATCNVTSNFDYTGTFIAYLNNKNCSAAPVLNLIYHLVDGVGTSLKCTEFSQTQQDYEVPRYLQSYVSQNVTDVLAFQAEYHRNMGMTKAVMDNFVNEVVAALNAHGVLPSAYTPLAEAINTYYYAGTYGLINVNATECPTDWRFDTLSDSKTGCVKNAAGALTVSLSVVVALFAMLF